MAARFAPFLNRMRSAPKGPFAKELSWKLFTFATWVPAIIFFNSNIGEVTTVTGESMYPFFNADIDRTTNGDACWTNKWKPLEGLRRGMIVTFW